MLPLVRRCLLSLTGVVSLVMMLSQGMGCASQSEYVPLITAPLPPGGVEIRGGPRAPRGRRTSVTPRLSSGFDLATPHISLASDLARILVLRQRSRWATACALE